MPQKVIILYQSVSGGCWLPVEYVYPLGGVGGGAGDGERGQVKAELENGFFNLNVDLVGFDLHHGIFRSSSKTTHYFYIYIYLNLFCYHCLHLQIVPHSSALLFLVFFFCRATCRVKKIRVTAVFVKYFPPALLTWHTPGWHLQTSNAHAPALTVAGDSK